VFSLVLTEKYGRNGSGRNAAKEVSQHKTNDHSPNLTALNKIIPRLTDIIKQIVFNNLSNPDTARDQRMTKIKTVKGKKILKAGLVNALNQSNIHEK
jgi:hypothetical protein